MSIESIISTRVKDITILKEMIREETDTDLIMIYKYHINVDQRIIRELMRGNFIIADAMMREIRRSTEAMLMWRKT